MTEVLLVILMLLITWHVFDHIRLEAKLKKLKMDEEDHERDLQ